jgi:serine/threonine protein kinase
MPLDASKPVLQTVGNYDLLEKIAEGGMGTVYKARQQPSGDIVAIKIVPPHLSNNHVLLRRFEQEFKAARSLDHPNIVRALDFSSLGTSPYLVMEYVDGESLGQRLEREGKISEAEAIRLIAQVAQGLHRAHKQGLIHRDVKPDNILVTSDGVAKLADLGLVKEMEADLNLTRTGRGLGTPHFMAPEQFRNAKNADARCDIYSMAATLYMMVTGELPFRSCAPLDAWMKKVQNEITPPREVNPSLSERIDWAIRRGMSADPEQRPATCREFVEDLTGHSTRKLQTPESLAAGQDLWFLVYKDDDGESHMVKGGVQAIRRSLKEGLLGDASNVKAGRSKNGPFEPLRGYPEFRDLVVTPASAPRTAPRSVPPVTPVPDATEREPRRPGEKETRRQVGKDTVRRDPPAADPAAPGLPQIEFGEQRSSRYDWILWVLILLVALATGALGFYFFPK